MIAVTLHESDRCKDIREIAEPRATQLQIIQDLHPGKGRESLPVHYVSDNRDLHAVEPLSLGTYSNLSRNHLEPLLDALEQGDIELATALTPDGMRLCGYRVVPEAFEFFGGSEYGPDEWTVKVSSGIYPIFAKRFVYDETQDQYTNELANYPGILCWYEGLVTYDNMRKDEIGSTRAVFSALHGHELARSILRPNEWSLYYQSPQKSYLVYPFQAKEMIYECNGRAIITHGVVDSSLPEYIPKGMDPVTLRNGGGDLPHTKGLKQLLQDATVRCGLTAHAFNTEPEIKFAHSR